MSKLPKEYQFTDLSDYGRPVARWIARTFVPTPITPVHVTVMFIVSGFIGICCILASYEIAAAFFLIFKSILDAADGELARMRKKPSYIGRFFDSISDIILNLLILLSVWYITQSSILLTLLAFFGIQLQGTLYNYYYVILRNHAQGDTTSRIFEEEVPEALHGENQKMVTFLFKLYKILYGPFDRIIYALDFQASESSNFPSWFMTALSTFGLGFQLLMIGLLLVVGLQDLIIPFFIGYTGMVLVFIGMRRYML